MLCSAKERCKDLQLEETPEIASWNWLLFSVIADILQSWSINPDTEWNGSMSTPWLKVITEQQISNSANQHECSLQWVEALEM